MKLSQSLTKKAARHKRNAHGQVPIFSFDSANQECLLADGISQDLPAIGLRPTHVMHTCAISLSILSRLFAYDVTYDNVSYASLGRSSKTQSSDLSLSLSRLPRTAKELISARTSSYLSIRQRTIPRSRLYSGPMVSRLDLGWLYDSLKLVLSREVLTRYLLVAFRFLPKVLQCELARRNSASAYFSIVLKIQLIFVCMLRTLCRFELNAII